MFDQPTAIQATERDLAAITGRLDGLADADWNAPVRCRGWQVTDLAVHVAGAAGGQAEALRRGATGVTDLARLAPPPDRDPRSLIADLKDRQDRLISALRELPQHALEGTVPLPFGLLPAAVALQIVPLEYGFHRNDLDWALGDPVPLSQDISSTLLGIVPGLLPMLAGGSPVHNPGARPAEPVSFQLTTPSARFLASYAADGWSVTPYDSSAAVTCQISGDNSAVALFIMGRISASHPTITASNPSAAHAFKRYFPGP